MGLTRALRRAGLARPHLFVVTFPGGTATRLAAERFARGAGWPLADAPADADVLLGCGPGSAEPEEWTDRVWRSVPAPRVRRQASDAGAVPAALRSARVELVERGGQAEPAGDGGTELPDGPMMADRAADRDGLRLDVLHVTLGPALPLWPAGLMLRVALQGDVVQDVRVRGVGLVEDHHAFWDEPWRRSPAGVPVPVADAERRRAASYLDSLHRLLAVAGWDGPAERCARLRDDLLAGLPAEAVAAAFAPLARRVSRSRPLRSMTDGLGVVDPRTAGECGVTGPARRAVDGGGDVTARLLRWVRETGVALDAAAVAGGDLVPVDGQADGPRGRLGGEPPSLALLRLLPRVLVGCELAAVRLIVASLDPDLDGLGARAVVGAHGG